MARKFIKFTKKDKMIIQDFVSNIDNSLIIETSPEKRFECDIAQKTIYLGTKNTDKYEKAAFIKWYKAQDFFTPMNRRILSLLHEIGHFKTYNEIEFEERNTIEDMITFMYEQGAINYQELSKAYFEIPNELKATQWGVQYYKNHTQECKELAKRLGLNKY